ncbi:MAG: YwaF family protein [Clostridia bacterium]|nr:YwaF family protein [Clostridia bacterium]
MKFELWSAWHFLYITSPLVIFFIIYALLRKRSDRAKNIVGYILGAISVSILIIRNIDIFARSGWGVEVIPLQVCHIGSLIAGVSVIFKKKWLILTSFCFNMIPALLAMVFADSLANYDTLWRIRPQTYVWGHIFIVVCALYGIFMFRSAFKKKDLLLSLGFVGTMAIVAVICNSLFRALLGWEPNYFYLFNYKGTPLKFLYQVFPSSVYGWFEINWFYTVVLLLFFVCVFIGLYLVARLINDRVFKYKARNKDI